MTTRGSYLSGVKTCPECLCPQGRSTPTGQSSFLGLTSCSIRDFLKSKKPHIPLGLRPVDGVKEEEEVRVSHRQIEAKMEGGPPPIGISGHKGSLLCDYIHGSVDDKDNSPMMRTVLTRTVCKVYRFQEESSQWMLVRELMGETPLSFSLPKQLLHLLMRSHSRSIQELNELGHLSPQWEGLRNDIITQRSQLITTYQETLTELNRHTASGKCFKPSTSKTHRHLQFIPTNLHAQRMQVTGHNSPGVWYEVITVGAPAHHLQGFRHGGLHSLLPMATTPDPSRHQRIKRRGLHRLLSTTTTFDPHNARRSRFSKAVSYSPEESSRARELLANISQLQPLILGLSEELLGASLELSSTSLLRALHSLALKTEQFVHAVKEELVRSALLALHNTSPAHTDDCHAPVTNSNGGCSANEEAEASLRRQDLDRLDEFDEEEWDRVWANVAKSLNCIIAMVDRLTEKHHRPQDVTSQQQQEVMRANGSYSNSVAGGGCSWHEQLLPLVVTLRECVREAVLRARAAMTFVVLQRAAEDSALSPLLTQRRDAVFSQALSSAVTGVALKLCSCLDDPLFLDQLLKVGVLAQFEGLLSTYGEEIGMLEDMEVGVSDLSRVTFTITMAKTDQPTQLLPTLTGQPDCWVVEVPLPPDTFSRLPGELRSGGVIRLCPVLFNIGINQQQSLAERFGDSSLQDRINEQSCAALRTYCSALRETLPSSSQRGVEELMKTLELCVESRRRKNVQVLELAAALCRRVNGVRLTSCKSAKDRSSMSVTLEQCVLLRDQHTLRQEHFNNALDCMRRARVGWGQLQGCYSPAEWLRSGPEERPRAPGSHFYPVAVLLLTSHLLALWLILSLVLLLADYPGCRGLQVAERGEEHWEGEYAFNSVQLLTFPHLYRAPTGSYCGTARS